MKEDIYLSFGAIIGRVEYIVKLKLTLFKNNQHRSSGLPETLVCYTTNKQNFMGESKMCSPWNTHIIFIKFNNWSRYNIYIHICFYIFYNVELLNVNWFACHFLNGSFNLISVWLFQIINTKKYRKTKIIREINHSFQNSLSRDLKLWFKSSQKLYVPLPPKKNVVL